MDKQKIEIMAVENFDEINNIFNFMVKNIPDGYEMADFQVTEMKDGFILKSTIKEKSEWYGE